MIICHKCSGLLTKENNDIVNAFGYCGCISGYVRDWQKGASIKDCKSIAIDNHKATIKHLELRKVNGDDKIIERLKNKIEKIEALEVEEKKNV